MKYRIDRSITLLNSASLFRGLSLNRSGVPILMYHSISDNLNKSRHPYYETSTSPRTFRMQMRFLKENGYRVIDLFELQMLFSKGISPHEKCAVITFDDGFKDFKSEAFPILKEFGFSAAVFLPTDLIGKTFLGHPCLSWDDVRQLQKDGIIFGSHTATHAKLYGLSIKKIKSELSQSKKTIEYKTGHSTVFFSYPFAFPDHDSNFIELFKRLCIDIGYSLCMTTRVGTTIHNDFPFIMKRLPINDYDDNKLFAAKLTGAYDWLYRAQILLKKAKHSKLFSRNNSNFT